METKAVGDFVEIKVLNTMAFSNSKDSGTCKLRNDVPGRKPGGEVAGGRPGGEVPGRMPSKEVDGNMLDSKKAPNTTTPTTFVSAPVIAGIDLGTTYFRYAFKFSSEGTIFIEKGKEMEPTCLLLKPDKTFASLGYKAVDMFFNSLDPYNQKRFYFFHHFKMRLYTTKLSRDAKLTDATGKEMAALQVFSIVFTELGQCILHQINLSKVASITVTADDVCWMITIPAIWTDEARQFMREAASMAGLLKNRLVLEPEAAALYAVNQSLCLRNDFKMGKFGPGSKYILADLGGGTADICVHEMLDGNRLRELYRATGGYAGGSTVNQACLKVFEDIFGGKAMELFQKDYPHAYHELGSQIEEKKCHFSRHSDAIVLRLDKDFIALVKGNKWAKESVDAKISQSTLGDGISYRKQGHILKIERSVVQKMFAPSVNTIIACLRSILTECADDTITSLLLVGGYSQSDYVVDTITNSFPDMNIILVAEGRLTVVKGAVLMGTQPMDITERRARFTYGFSCSPLFVEGRHPEKLKFYSEGKFWCSGVFHKLIEAGQLLKYGQEFTIEFWESNKGSGAEKKHKPRFFSLWRSPLKNPGYCTLEEDKCEKVGMIEVAAPPEGWPDAVVWKKTLVVRETELQMKIIVKQTGESQEKAIDFL